MNNQNQPLIFECSTEGRIGYSLPEMDIEAVNIEELIPSSYLREKEAELPEVS